ncbi:MAG: Ig-like domain-containing protein, partial [Bacteroidetes bacterium]|nr:Ig-like domain-containing protein [Bacteroidota bacterium]
MLEVPHNYQIQQQVVFGVVVIQQNATITYTVTNSNGCTSTATTIVTVNPKPTVQPITGTNSTCVGSTTALSVSTPTGGVWTTSDNAVAIVSPQTPNNNATVIGMGAGTSTITYTVTNGNGCSTAVSSLVTISPTLVVASIVGNSTVCIGANPNPTYTCTTTGGTWSSSNTAVLNINTTTGAATGATAGTSTVTYTVNKGGTCVASSTLNVTVANRPGTPTVSGANTVCVNDSILLTGTSTPTGLAGYWKYVTGGGPGITFLSVDSLTGWLKGLSATFGGGANVTYTVSNAAGCTRTSNNYAITVNAGPNISNNNPANGTICVGQTTNFTNNTAGGTWNSSNTSIATINPTTGVATGVATGNTVINYVVTNVTGCASAARSFVTVNTTPNSGTLSGQSNVCVGSTTTLVASVTGGAWSSSNTAVAIVSNSGAVTGTGVGTCTISYTVTTGGGGCSSSATKLITVNAVPTVSSITTIPSGQNGVCVNSTLQLANATSGGTWASSNNTRATVDATGLVTGVGAGAIIITYTVSNGTCSATAFGNGTVYSLPTVAAISG